MSIKVYNNRIVIPSTIKLSNMYENRSKYLEFDFTDVITKGNKYLVCKHESEQTFKTPLLLSDDKLIVKTFMNASPGTYKSLIIISDTTIDDNYDFSSDNLLFVSNMFDLIVDENFLNGSSKEWELPDSINIKFDELLALISKVNEDLDSGAFNGVGIDSISKKSTQGNVDTYTITFTNGKTFEYNVTNGVDGKSPIVTVQNGNWFVNGEDTGQKAQGDKGERGEQGKSAYQVAVDNGFVGSEQEWLDSLDYEHSDEFTNLANQVKEDAKISTQTVETVTQIKTDVEDKATEFEQIVQNANDDFDNKVNQVNSDLDTKIQQANTTIDEKVTEATNQATKAKEEADRATLATDGKLDKNQGTDNVGKVMVVGEDGELTPTEYKSGSDNKLIGTVAKSENPNIIDSYQTEMMNLKLYGKSTQESTTGAQLITYPYYSGDNIVLNGVNCTVNDDGSINFNGTTTAGFNYNLVYGNNYILKAGTYTFSCVGNIPSYFYLYIYDKVNYEVITTLNTQSKSRTFTIDEDKTVYIYLNCGTIGTNINTTLYIMLNEGSSALPYEPYTGGQPSPNPQYPQSITKIEKFDGNIRNSFQLFDASKLPTYTQGGATVTNNGDGSFTISGSGDLSEPYTKSYVLYRDTALKLIKQGTINSIGSNNVPEFYVAGLDSNGAVLFTTRTSGKAKITQDNIEKINTLGFYFYSPNGTITPTTFYPTVWQDGDGTWEPFDNNPQELSYTPTNPMYSTQDGSISDYVDVEKGVEVYNMSGEVVFDGSEDERWNIYGNNGFYIVSSNMKSGYAQKGLCNKFKVTNSVSETSVILGLNNNIIYIVQVNQYATTADEWKQWLSENPITIVYPLTTPTEIPINPIQLAILRALYTYNGVTNFLCNAPVSFDYEQSLQIVIQNIWNAIGQTNANILLNGGNQ